MLSLAALLIAIPAVVLSSEHEAMCQVGVGDAFPALEGQSADGGATAVASLLGEKATVVATPGGLDWMREMLANDLRDDFAPKYGDRGVRFVAISGKPSDGVQALAIDPTKLADALGKGQGPRVYVLDPAGKILWFDLEYTLSTHRELHAALDELVGE